MAYFVTLPNGTVLLSQIVALMGRGWGENGFLFPTLTPAPPPPPPFPRELARRTLTYIFSCNIKEK